MYRHNARPLLSSKRNVLRTGDVAFEAHLHESFSFFLAEKCGIYKGYTGTRYKNSIAATRRATNWRPTLMVICKIFFLILWTAVVWWSDYRPLTKAKSFRFPVGSHDGFSHLGIVLDDVAGRMVFSGIFRFPRSCIPALLHARLASPSLALKISWQVSNRLVHGGGVGRGEGMLLYDVVIGGPIIKVDVGATRDWGSQQSSQSGRCAICAAIPYPSPKPKQPFREGNSHPRHVSGPPTSLERPSRRLILTSRAIIQRGFSPSTPLMYLHRRHSLSISTSPPPPPNHMKIAASADPHRALVDAVPARDHALQTRAAVCSEDVSHIVNTISEHSKMAKTDFFKVLYFRVYTSDTCETTQGPCIEPSYRLSANKSREYTQCDKNNVRQFRGLRLAAMAHLMRVAISPLRLWRFSVSKAEINARVIEVSLEQHRSVRVEETGEPRPEIEPGSPWSEARKLTAQSPPRPLLHARLPPRRTGLNPGRVAGLSQVGIVSDDAVGRRVFLGISRFPRPVIPAPLHTQTNLIGSQDLAVKSRPNLFTPSLPHVGTEGLLRASRIVEVLRLRSGKHFEILTNRREAFPILCLPARADIRKLLFLPYLNASSTTTSLETGRQFRIFAHGLFTPISAANVCYHVSPIPLLSCVAHTSVKLVCGDDNVQHQRH
ncbi:hypothetical protein PR048_010373 [Dryococelus australis]|uniref:Uncharacterized protein n=1 Tax=Dryococelus australis TaxID=614101 RepID=A0ABQ9I2I5_9NEOP|nr:hypothetical protein PR048_010373 [Dryococelus australis]